MEQRNLISIALTTHEKPQQKIEMKTPLKKVVIALHLRGAGSVVLFGNEIHYQKSAPVALGALRI
jgi:hypothetical protein